METFPIIDKGELQVDGKLYRYKIRKLHNNLGANYLEVWNEKDEQGTSVIFEDKTVEDMIKMITEYRKW